MSLLSILLQVPETLNKLKTGTTPDHLSFFELLVKGGVILIPIGLLSIIAIYLIGEKYFTINKGTYINKKVQKEFKDFVKQGETKKAISALQNQQGSYATIFLHFLKNIGQPVKEIENEVETISNIEVARLTRNLNYLGLIAGIAPMLGFIGTISGIIKIFYNISVTDNISIGIISGGLYEKMISSGSGLIVGVIAYSGYHILNMKLDRFISLVEAESFEVLTVLKDKNNGTV